ncbi:Sec-independent protein translocase subunit TatA [Amycolatopsis sp. NPDC026612]|uniref:Sec-independent protein translocase subunit TatA n=1 Tax=Amycolatopsis sp. NPDC026612 TaxID=3155466 RepID=UPI0034107E87
MGGLSISHWLIVLLVVVLLFGARRLPDTARGLARSLRIFKSEIADDDATKARQQASGGEQPQPQPLPWPNVEASRPDAASVPAQPAAKPAATVSSAPPDTTASSNGSTSSA